MITRLRIVDPTLRDEIGHNCDYARLVAADAASAGLDVVIFAHARSSPLAKLVHPAILVPHFSAGLRDLPPRPLDPLRRLVGVPARRALRTVRRRLVKPTADEVEQAAWRSSHRFSAELETLLQSTPPARCERLFFPNVSWADGVQAARALSDAQCETLVLLRFDPPNADWAHGQLRRAAAETRAVWMSDTEELARAYEAILDKPVLVGKVPVDEALLAAGAARRGRAPPVRFAFLGEARAEKGFMNLPRAFEVVLADPVAQAFSFHVQAFATAEGGAEDASRAIARLRRLAPQVSVVDGALSSEAFLGLLCGSHVLLLPYDPVAYQLRSSGLLVQALVARMSVVAPSRESWPTRMLSYTPSGQAALYDPSDANAFASAIISSGRGVLERGGLGWPAFNKFVTTAPWALPHRIQPDV